MNLNERINNLNPSESKKIHYGDELFLTLITEENTLPLDQFSRNNSGVTVSPQRGGTLPSLILNGIEIFYNESAKRNDLQATIREGFYMGPQAGPFSSEQNEEYGYDLKRHGFLRDLPWTNTTKSDGTITYEFKTDENTIKQFPHHFTAQQNIILQDNKAYISLDIENNGENDMPFAPGHHTYYKIDPATKDKVALSPNMGVDEENKAKRLSGIETIKIKNPKETCEVYIPGTGKLHINFDNQFEYLRLRTEKDKGFICIEPVVCHPSNWKEQAKTIKTGEKLSIGFSIELVEQEK